MVRGRPFFSRCCCLFTQRWGGHFAVGDFAWQASVGKPMAKVRWGTGDSVCAVGWGAASALVLRRYGRIADRWAEEYFVGGGWVARDWAG